MDTISQLHDLGFDLPTPAYLAGLLLFGVIGMVAYARGKRAQRPAMRWLGLALMLYPYVVPQTWLLYLVGVGLCVGLYVSAQRA
jgi:hypothetical protein